MSNFGAGDGIPFVAGSIRGHRVWNFRSSYLVSPSQHTYWDGGIGEATCREEDAKNEENEAYYEREQRMALTAQPLLPQGCFYYKYDLDLHKNQVTLHWGTDYWFPFDRSGRPELPEQTEELRYETVIEKISRYLNGWDEDPVDDPHLTVRGTLVVDYEHFMDLYESTKSEEIKESHFPRCSCGFYAYYDRNTPNMYASGDVVHGIVEGFGETVIGTEGFRSQKMKIIALTCSSDTEARLKSRTKDYDGVDFFRKASHMHKAYPVTVPEEVSQLLDNNETRINA